MHSLPTPAFSAIIAHENNDGRCHAAHDPAFLSSGSKKWLSEPSMRHRIVGLSPGQTDRQPVRLRYFRRTSSNFEFALRSRGAPSQPKSWFGSRHP